MPPPYVDTLAPALAPIRAARESDLPEIAALDAALHGPLADAPKLWKKWFDRDDRAIFVAERRGAVVGFALLRVHCDHVELEIVAVNSGFRHRGIGRQLAYRCVTEADGCEFRATVGERNLGGQIFLRSLGFRYVRSLDRPLTEDKDYLFVRRPSPPAPPSYPPHPAPAEFHKRPIVP